MGVYTDKDRIQHVLTEASMDFASNNAGGTIRGPRGKQGRLIRAIFRASTTIAGTTGDAKINIGNGSDADAYMSWSIGEPAADTERLTDDAVQTSNPIILDRLPADTDILVAIVEDTTGDGAGDGVLTVIIDWDY